MRKVVIGTAVALTMLTGAWLVTQSLAGHRVQAVIAANPALQARAVRPLRDPRRIGLQMTDLQYSDPALGLALPWTRIWLSPLSPLTARMALPDQGRLLQGGDSFDLGLTRSQVSLSVAPLKGLAADHLNLEIGGISLDGRPMAEELSLQARLAPLGVDAPDVAHAAYDVQILLGGLQPEALARIGLDPGPLPGPVGAEGPLRLWVDRMPRITGDTPPVVVGWQTPGLSLRAGEIGLRVVGRLSRDKQGRAEGQLALYSADADAMIGLAAGLGLIPAQGQMLLRAGLAHLARAPLDDSLPGPDFPEPAGGELRLPILMRQGQLMLGGMAIGAAPNF